MNNYVLIKNDTLIAGPSSINGKIPEDMKRMANNKGGVIISAEIVKPPLNRTQTHGAYSVDIQAGKAILTYPVVDLPLESVCAKLVSEIKTEAATRILKIWESDSTVDSLVRQANASRADIASGETDERFTQTDSIRTASNEFEAELAVMERAELAALNVAEWDGWADEEE